MDQPPSWQPLFTIDDRATVEIQIALVKSTQDTLSMDIIFQSHVMKSYQLRTEYRNLKVS